MGFCRSLTGGSLPSHPWEMAKTPKKSAVSMMAVRSHPALMAVVTLLMPVSVFLLSLGVGVVLFSFMMWGG